MTHIAGAAIPVVYIYNVYPSVFSRLWLQAMRATISRWGNSLGIRIPKSALIDAHLAEGDLLEITPHDGKLVMIRKENRPSLDQLVSAITSENRHDESFDVPVGKENW